jgi:hypothetical protein
MKESLISIEKGIIFKATLNNEASERNNYYGRGTPNNVYFNENGYGVFNLANNYISYNHVNWINNGDNNWAMRAFVQFSSDANMAIIGQGSDGVNRILLGYATGTGIVFIARDATSIVGQLDWAFTPDLSLWYDIILVKNSTNYILYINSVLQSSQSDADVFYIFDGTMRIGQNLTGAGTWGNSFNGNIDFVKIYNYALNAQEISNLFAKKTYRAIGISNQVINIDASNGYINDRFSHSIINTNTALKKMGSIYIMDFDGSSSQLDLGDVDPDYNITDNLSVFIWFKNNNALLASNEEIISKWKSGAGREWTVIIGPGEKITIVLEQTNTWQSTNALTVNKWNFLGFTKTGTNFNVYHNGQALNGSFIIGSCPASLTPTNAKILIGNRDSGANYWDGQINNVMIKKNNIIIPNEAMQMYTNSKNKYI